MKKEIPDIGQMAPEIQGLKATGDRFQLSWPLQKSSNVILVFYRGHWWPFCVSQLAELKKINEEISRFDTKIFAISVDSPKQSIAFLKEMRLPFDLLCDVDKEIVKRYHLLNPHEHGGIAYPAIFIIKKSGIIGFRSLDRTAKRVDLSAILDYLKQQENDPELLVRSESNKKNIVPKLSDLKHIGSNMILRGTREDWKHYLEYPAFIIKSIYRSRKKG